MTQLPLLPGIEPERREGRYREGLPIGSSGVFLVKPLRHQLGPGPEGKRCCDCTHLQRYRQGKMWFKCDLRTKGGSRSTDHRATWPTCVRFEEAE